MLRDALLRNAPQHEAERDFPTYCYHTRCIVMSTGGPLAMVW
jgi:hypothetical protein